MKGNLKFENFKFINSIGRCDFEGKIENLSLKLIFANYNAKMPYPFIHVQESSINMNLENWDFDMSGDLSGILKNGYDIFKGEI